jgi:hypothetical protein
MKTLYRLGSAVYEQVGDRLLLKAKHTPSPGQLSMFDETAHPRDESGKFSSGGGSTGGSGTSKIRGNSKPSTAKEPSGKIGEQELARSVVNREKGYGFARIPKDDAAYEGLDYKHPGSHWFDGQESFFAKMMDAYKNKDAEGVGKAFIERLDFTDELSWSTGNAIIKNAINSANWDSLHDLAKKLSLGSTPSLKSKNPVDKILGDYLKSIFEWGREDEKDAGVDFAEIMSPHLESPESLRKWIVKQGATRLDKDESGAALDLAQSVVKSFDAKALGQAIAEELKIPQALEREKETGYKNGVIKPWERSEAGLDSKAWKRVQSKTDWSLVEVVAAKLAEDPDYDWVSESAENANQATSVVLESLRTLLKQDGGDKIKSYIRQFDPAHIARIQIEESLKDLPEIRKLGEADG